MTTPAAAAPPDDDLHAALAAAAGPHGAWPRLPASRRHDPAAWAAVRFLEREGLVRPTGDVRGDRAGFRATEGGIAILAVLAAADVLHAARTTPSSAPPKPRIRAKARP